MRRYLTLYVGLLCLCGCASADSGRYARAPQYPPTDPAAIQIYNVEPDEPYQKLGEISYHGMTIASSSGAGKMLREKAAAMGADAVLILQNEISSNGKRMFAVAIKFKQQSRLIGDY